MLRWKKKIRRMLYITTDFFCIIASLLIVNSLYVTRFNGSLAVNDLEMLGFLTITTVIFLSLFLMTNVYEDTIKNEGQFSPRILVKMAIDLALGVILTGAVLFYMHVSLSRLFIFGYISILVVLVVVNRVILQRLMFNETPDRQAAKNILVVGQSSNGKAYIEEIRKHKYLNLNILGYIHIKQPETYDDVPHLGGLDNLFELIKEHVIDEIAVARPLSYDDRLKEVLDECQEMGITITMLLDLQNTDSSKAHVAMVGNIPVLKFHTVSLNENQLFAKRVLDVIGAMAGMVLFGIAFIIFAPLIRLETPGSVIFKQKRVGKNGRMFEIWKFRSMGVNAEAQKEALLAFNEMNGHMFKMSNDPRITKIGAFLRKTSLDELPQFYNVLKGDMSLVGTRPPTVNEVNNYELRHHKRISIMPGITGNWQVNGRSEIEDFEEVVRLDAEYISNWTIWLDIKILFKTVHVVLSKRGSK